MYLDVSTWIFQDRNLSKLFKKIKLYVYILNKGKKSMSKVNLIKVDNLNPETEDIDVLNFTICKKVCQMLFS